PDSPPQGERELFCSPREEGRGAGFTSPLVGEVGPPIGGTGEGTPERGPYVELHAASAFSFLEGASEPETLIDAAVEKNLSAIALVDRDGVYGAPRFYQAAKKSGVRALVGAEVTLDWENLGPPLLRPRLTLLVENRAGYK